MKGVYSENISDDTLSDGLNYVMETIMPQIYNDKKIGKWAITVKGGQNFKNFVDMDMRDHYITGIACAYRILDIYKIRNKEIKYNINKLKRASFIYLFHDYNKLTNDEISMPDCKEKIKDLLEKYPNLKNIAIELNLSIEEICHGAYSTELGTSFENIFNTDSTLENMSFENSFSTLADSISSFYARSENKDNFPAKIYLGGELIINSSDVHFIEFQHNSLFAIKGLVRSAIRNYINKLECHLFIWDTENRLYYIGKKIEENELSQVQNNFNTELYELLNSPGSKLIEMTDRTIRAPILRFLRINKDIINTYAQKNIGEILHMPSREISNDERDEAEKYSIRINNLGIENFYMDFAGKKAYRDAGINNITDIDKEFALRLFSVRAFQLKYLNSKPSIEVPDLGNAVERYFKELLMDFKDLIGKDKEKSVFIVPFVAADMSLDWKSINSKLIENLNAEQHSEINFNEVLNSTVSSFIPKIEDVPEKSQMSMITGGQAKIDAIEENLYGVNHQTFSNRTVVSIKNSGGKIDAISVYENMIRKLLLKKSADAVIYAKFPGPIPVFSIESILKMIKKSDIRNSTKNVEMGLTIGNLEIPAMTGDYIEIPVQSLRRDLDFIFLIKNIINLAEKTGMHISVVPVNMFSEMDNLIIKINIFNEILNELGFSSIGIDNLYKKDEELQLYFKMATSANKVDKIMRSVASEPMAIFYYAVNAKLFSLNYYDKIREIIKIRGVEMKNLEELAEIAVKLNAVSERGSNTDKTWLLRDGFEVLEKMMVVTKKPLDELYDVCAGQLYVEADRRLKYKKNPIENTGNFTKTLIKMINDDFHGKLPSGNLKTYLISGFEYLYLVKSKEFFEKKNKKVE